MRKIFVSGCYDILHAGHIQFFEEARAMGDYLIVSFASEETRKHHDQNPPSLSDEHRKVLLESLRMVDKVVVGTGIRPGLDFEEAFLAERPDMLVVTEDDPYGDLKRALCAKTGAQYVALPKIQPRFDPLSTTLSVTPVKAPHFLPLCVNFTGEGLDIAGFPRGGAYVVNCAITPFVSLVKWPYERNSGLGGSSAWAMLEGKNPIQSERERRMGWQAPAVISDTGFCVWKSGAKPVLDFKNTGDFLKGKMAIYHTSMAHNTSSLMGVTRDYKRIVQSSLIAKEGVRENNPDILAAGVALYYDIQRDEGMTPLPEIGNSQAKKYLGGCQGGYALYLFENEKERDEAVSSHPKMMAIEPYYRNILNNYCY